LHFRFSKECLFALFWKVEKAFYSFDWYLLIWKSFDSVIRQTRHCMFGLRCRYSFKSVLHV
jgi:hypothetical protein